MPSSIDPAILKALSLDASANLTRHGGSGFSSTSRITTPTTSIFLKTSSATGAETMFKGEFASLNAIHARVPSLTPRGLAWGPLDAGGYFLATEFLDMSRTGNSSTSLAAKLTQLHTTPVQSAFGFEVSTCCGETEQDNAFKESWAEFFAQNRLMHILKCAERNNGKDGELRRAVEGVVAKVVPRLLADGHLGGSEGVKPVVCHGDLWSGNKGKAVFAGRGEDVEDVVFDPSVCYGHNEYDHGIMNMFGGFSSSFWKEYRAICPKTQPVDEYEDRVKLYEAYHHLNHYAMFGGGYKGGALSILNGLLRKYG